MDGEIVGIGGNSANLGTCRSPNPGASRRNKSPTSVYPRRVLSRAFHPTCATRHALPCNRLPIWGYAGYLRSTNAGAIVTIHRKLHSQGGNLIAFPDSPDLKSICTNNSNLPYMASICSTARPRSKFHCRWLTLWRCPYDVLQQTGLSPSTMCTLG